MDVPTLERVIRVLRSETRKLKVPVVTLIARTKRDPYKVLVSCLLSLRTKDATTVAATDRLFRVASTPEAMVRVPAGRLEKLIYPVGFYRVKARVLRGVSRDVLGRFGGRVPSRLEELLTLKGVGRKTANLVRTLGYGLPGICVDTHVHRISNRLGFVKTRTPEETEFALRKKLPRRHWIRYNDLLVAHGQHVCHPVSPRCSICRVAPYCEKVGVGRRR
jgi:endonuclease-3